MGNWNYQITKLLNYQIKRRTEPAEDSWFLWRAKRERIPWRFGHQ